MPDKPAQDRTEVATPRRRSEAKEKGNVARSMELNSVAVLFAGILSLQVVAGDFIDRLSGFMISTYRNSNFISLTPASLPEQAFMLVKYVVLMVAPVMAAIVVAGIAINFAQVGPVFASKALTPKFSKISPVSGIKRLFSLRSLVELIKGILKVSIVAFICSRVIGNHIDEYLGLVYLPVIKIIAFLAGLLLEMAIYVGLALLVMAVADFAYQKWDYEKNLKMTKQEVREEVKQHEGDPQIKGRIKAAQRQLARKRMMAAVPEATVVVTNPTHVAIALKYTPVHSSDAPVVVAKGKRKLAERIKRIAAEHNVPIVEDRPLAWSLYESSEVGMEIPLPLYQAVAEILAYVFSSQSNSSYNRNGLVNGR